MNRFFPQIVTAVLVILVVFVALLMLLRFLSRETRERDSPYRDALAARAQQERVLLDGIEYEVTSVAEWYDHSVGMLEEISSGIWRQYTVQPAEGAHVVLWRHMHQVGALDGSGGYYLYVQLPGSLKDGDIVENFPIASQREPSSDAALSTGEGKPVSPMRPGEATAFIFATPVLVARIHDDDPASIGSIEVLAMDPETVSLRIQIMAQAIEINDDIRLPRRAHNEFLPGLRSP